MRVGGGNRARGEDGRKKQLPANSTANDAKKRIDGVIDFFAGQAPKRGFPENGVFAEKCEFAAVEPLDAKCTCDGN